MASRKTLAYGLTANVVILGVISLFTDVSSEMILPILPFFLTQVLLASPLVVGLVEGTADSVVSFMKIFSGQFSNAAGKRKRFVALGYGLSPAMKVPFPFAQTCRQFFPTRLVVPIGQRIRSAPRARTEAPETAISSDDLPRDPHASPRLHRDRGGFLLRRFLVRLHPAACGPRVRDDDRDPPLRLVQHRLRRPCVSRRDSLRSLRSKAGGPPRVYRVRRHGRPPGPLRRPQSPRPRIHPLWVELRDGGGHPTRARGGLCAAGD